MKTIPANAAIIDYREGLFVDTQTEVNEFETKRPIKMLARSSEAIDHWFWGKVVHDAAGANPTKARLPIDYCHDDTELIGYLENFTVTDEGLEATGYLISLDDNDVAAKVMKRSDAGIPYEASINFGGDGIRIEEYGPGETAQANGREYAGPVTVIRTWPLRGVAVCPYGADMNTQSEFSGNSRPGAAIPVTFTRTTDEDSKAMKLADFFTRKPVDAAPETKAEDAQADATELDQAVARDTATTINEETEAEAMAQEDANGDEQATDLADDAQDAQAEPETDNNPAPEGTTPNGQDHKQPEPEAAAMDAATADAKAFMDLFGETPGAVYFAKGMTLEDAMRRHIKAQAEELAAVRDQLNKLAKNRGIETPVGFSKPTDEPQPEGEGATTLKDGMKIRRRK